MEPETPAMGPGSPASEPESPARGLWDGRPLGPVKQTEEKSQIASMVEALDQAGIFSILWGTNALRLYGIPSIVWEFSFVVPDGQTAAGYNACLGVKDMYECHLAARCPLLKDLYASFTVKHLHYFPDDDPQENLSCGYGFYLFEMSEIFHPQRLPDLSVTGPDLMLASDPRIIIFSIEYGCGPYLPELHPVRVLTLRCYIETVIRLGVRDRSGELLDQNGRERCAIWLVSIRWIAEYICDKFPDLFDSTTLSPHFRWFWKKSCREFATMHTVKALDALKSKLLPWPVTTPQSSDSHVGL